MPHAPCSMLHAIPKGTIVQGTTAMQSTNLHLYLHAAALINIQVKKRAASRNHSVVTPHLSRRIDCTFLHCSIRFIPIPTGPDFYILHKTITLTFYSLRSSRAFIPFHFHFHSHFHPRQSSPQSSPNLHTSEQPPSFVLQPPINQNPLLFRSSLAHRPLPINYEISTRKWSLSSESSVFSADSRLSLSTLLRGCEQLPPPMLPQCTIRN
jgi:hypothetical protein